MFLYCLGLLLVGMTLGQAASQTCYTFLGDSHLRFSTSSLDISNSVHYKLKFKTTESSGILLYSEGEDDYEGLFIFNGRLVYLLTNPSPSGVEGTTGGFYQGEVRVNNGTWVTVEVWRNFQTEKQAPLSGIELRTGFTMYDNTGKVLESHTDNINHSGVVLDSIIFVGGISPSVVHARGSHVPSFKGQIEMLAELDNLDFRNPMANRDGKVKRCR